MKRKLDLNPSGETQSTQETFDKLSSVVSSMECTGLTPANVQDDQQSESFGDLYGIHAPKATEQEPERKARRNKHKL